MPKRATLLALSAALIYTPAATAEWLLVDATPGASIAIRDESGTRACTLDQALVRVVSASPGQITTSYLSVSMVCAPPAPAPTIDSCAMVPPASWCPTAPQPAPVVVKK